MSLDAVAALYFQVGETFGMGWLRYNAEKLPADSHWQKLAAATMIEELYGHQRGVTLRIIRDAKGKGDVLKIWSEKNVGLMDQTAQMRSELEAGDVVDLSMLAVASRQLSSIAGG
jgi:glutamate dehydrogenase